MDRKVIICGIAIIGLLSMLLNLSCMSIFGETYAEKLLNKMGDRSISKEEIRATIKEYYETYYKNVYPTYTDFINSLILSPLSLEGRKSHLRGNRSGFNYGSLYLRFFVVRAYYGSELLSKKTQNYIDNSLVNDDEDIMFGGMKGLSHISAALDITLGQLIKDLKENNQSGHNN